MHGCKSMAAVVEIYLILMMADAAGCMSVYKNTLAQLPLTSDLKSDLDVTKV
jgi:hypothetical protein